jgi:2'-5' RNA ligase
MKNILQLPAEALKASRLAFLPHHGPEPMEKYLAVNLSFSYFDQLRQQIEKALGGTPLLHRGEAHLTVLTPPEYNEHFSAFWGIEEISARLGERLQKTAITSLGLGSFVHPASKDSVFFIVAEAPEVFLIRRELAQALSAKNPQHQFQAANFEPHITVGFSLRDFFSQDGAVKTIRALDPRFILNIV